VTNSCEHGNKPFSIIGGEFYYYVSAVSTHEERRFFTELSSFHPLIEGKLAIQFEKHIISKHVLRFLYLTLYEHNKFREYNHKDPAEVFFHFTE
jgi:hypothetical protein